MAMLVGMGAALHEKPIETYAVESVDGNLRNKTEVRFYRMSRADLAKFGVKETFTNGAFHPELIFKDQSSLDMGLFPLKGENGNEKTIVTFTKQDSGDLTVTIEKVPEGKFTLVQDFETNRFTVRVAPDGTEDAPHMTEEGSLLRQCKNKLKKLFQ